MQTNERDPKLWKIAKKRAGFKKHLATYLVVNIFLWALWYVTSYRKGLEYSILPWPAWCTLGWGIGVVMDYIGAYVTPDRNTLAEKEYEKLLREKDRQ